MLLGGGDKPNKIPTLLLLPGLLINKFHIEEMNQTIFQTGLLNQIPTDPLFASIIDEVRDMIIGKGGTTEMITEKINGLMDQEVHPQTGTQKIRKMSE